MKQSDVEIWFNRIIIGFTFIGILSAIINFIYNRSLWVDEAMISLNIINSSFYDLLKPLEMNQVAPIGFLLIQKMMAMVFNNQDWSLRIFPLVAYLLSVLLIYKLSFRFFNNEKISLLSAAMFSLNLLVVYYSTEAKQYSSDIFICLLLIYCTVCLFPFQNKNAVIKLLLLGFVSIWISNIAVIVLFSAGLWMFFLNLKKQSAQRGVLSLVLLSWLVSFLVYYILFIKNHPSRNDMLVYWGRLYSFMPSNFFSFEPYRFIYLKFYFIFSDILHFKKYSIVFILFYFLGLVVSFRKTKFSFLFIFPFILHFLLSSQHLYPFETRLILYFIPLIIILLSAGIFYSFQFCSDRIKKIPILVILMPGILNIYSVFKKTPNQRQEIKQSLNFINQHIDSTQSIFVYERCKAPFLFYKNQYPNINDMQSSVSFGMLDRNDEQKANQSLKNIKKNTWLLFSNVYEGYRWSDEQYMLDKLKQNGYKIIQQKISVGSSCYEIIKNPL